MSTSTPRVVRPEYPDWVKVSPQMAADIATSDAIAQVKLTSIESTTKKNLYGLYNVEIIYRFDVVQYLKGGGAEVLNVRIVDWPPPFPASERTKSDAHKIERNWLSLSRAAVGHRRDGILLLSRGPNTGDLGFLRHEEPAYDYPAFGESWLYEVEDSMYRHQFTDGEPVDISLGDLKSRIEDMRRLTEGAYGECVKSALHWRNRVRSQLLDTYQEFRHPGGYRDPGPFPRFEVSLASHDSRHYPLFRSSRPVFEFRRPPYKLPMFSDYWLDGEDKDLYTIHVRIDAEYTYEGMAIANDLAPGTYSVHHGQYHQSLPCDEESPGVEGAWWSWNAAEWVVNVK
ncbi:MAG: hypothetical protein OXP73_06610 [Chloroflexota bacterium]|nr:hypothetical protein [Chloroflexota bacterium]